MKTASETKTDNTTGEETKTDKRRGMKLVAVDGERKKFRIDVADGMFERRPFHSDAGSSNSEALAADLRTDESVTGKTVESHRSGVTLKSIVLVAVATGLLLGYFAGRRRDS